MSQLIVEKLTNTVGAKTLFDNIAFTILSGEKVGLIGINGTGKSTLLSIVAGVGDADSVSMDHPNNYRIAYLLQEPEIDQDLTVMEAVFMSDAPIIRMNLEYEHALKALTSNPESVKNQEAFWGNSKRNGWNVRLGYKFEGENDFNSTRHRYVREKDGRTFRWPTKAGCSCESTY